MADIVLGCHDLRALTVACPPTGLAIINRFGGPKA